MTALSSSGETVVDVPRVRLVIHHWTPGPGLLSGFGSMSFTAWSPITVAEAARRYWRPEIMPKTMEILA